MTVIPSKRLLTVMGFILMSLAYLIAKDGASRILMMGAAFAGGIFLFLSGWYRWFFRKETVLYLFVIYLPFAKQMPGDFMHTIPGLNLTNFFVAVLAFFWLTGAKTNGPKWVRTPLNLPILWFMALGAVSILRGIFYGGEYLTESILEYFRTWFVPFFLYFFIVNTVEDRETVKNIVILIMMSVSIIALLSIHEYMDSDDRVGGIFDQPNMLAAFFNYYMFLPLGFFLLRSKRLLSWALLIPFLISFRGIMVTFSRAGYLTFAVSAFTITFFKSKRLFFILMLLGIFLWRNPVFLPEGIRYRLAQTIEKQATYSNPVELRSGTLDQSTGERIKVWQAALWMIREHPFLGVGYRLFQSKVQHYWAGGELNDPHNTFLLIASEMGLGALFAFLLILWRLFRSVRSVYKTSQDMFAKALALGFLAGLFGLFASNMFESRLNYPETACYFWILAALIVRLKFLDGKTS